ncbi:MAG: tetratricopeptide repeat protein [Bacteroidia bacterium]
MNKRISYSFTIILVLCMDLFSSAQHAFLDSTVAKKSIDSMEVLLSTAPDSGKARLNLFIAEEYQSFDRFKSFEHAKAAVAAAEKGSDKERLGIGLNFLGDLYWFSGDFAKSSENYYKALKIYEELNNKEGMAECYRNIGWIYQGQNRYKQTLEYYQKSLNINKELNLRSKILANYDDMGICYKLMGNYPEALKYSNMELEMSKQEKSDKGMATGYANLASVYVEMNQLDLAIENFQLSNKYHENINDHFNSSAGYVGLASCFLKLGNYTKAIEYADKAASVASSFDYRGTLADACNVLARAYVKKGDYENGYKYLELYARMNDSTYNAQNSQQINEMAAKYESEKKEMMISSLEEKSDQDKKFKIFIVIVAIVIAGFSVVLFRGNIQKKKANNSLSLAYKEIEVKNKDITDSINYAKTIQRARLSNPSIILDQFPDTFGLYKPKDVVSGDFYWFAEHENGKLMVAVADCTGHGIPGAFMSMIGIDELNHATLEKRIDDPAAVLSSVNRGVKKALRQDEKDSSSRDGMDMALCILHKKKMMLEYSGANRPLYLIRDNELTELVPTKVAIGGITPTDQEFSCKTIEIRKNDMLYMFTDGYADQFGGPEGKKFMTKRFKELLLSIHMKPAQEQEALLEKSLNDWKKNVSQVDDILVLGIRI